MLIFEQKRNEGAGVPSMKTSTTCAIMLLAGFFFVAVGSALCQTGGYAGYPVGGAFVPVPSQEAEMPSAGPVPGGPVPHQPPPPGDTVVITTGVVESAGTIQATRGTIPPGTTPSLVDVPPGVTYPTIVPPGTGIPALRPSYEPLTGDIIWDPVTRRYGMRAPVVADTAPFGLSGPASPTRSGAGTAAPAASRTGRRGEAARSPGGPGSTAPFDATGGARTSPGGTSGR
jgi:hypothetical protein